MTNLTLLDLVFNPVEEQFGQDFIPFLLITLALLGGAIWIVRRILLGRERVKQVEHPAGH